MDSKHQLMHPNNIQQIHILLAYYRRDHRRGGGTHLCRLVRQPKEGKIWKGSEAFFFSFTSQPLANTTQRRHTPLHDPYMQIPHIDNAGLVLDGETYQQR